MSVDRLGNQCCVGVRAVEAQQVAGDDPVPVQWPASRAGRAEVDIADDIRVEKFKQLGQVATGARGNESTRNEILVDGFGGESGRPGFGLDASPCATRKLTAGGWS